MTFTQKKTLLTLILLGLTGCAQVVELEKATTTTLSDTIWLTPIANTNKTIFIDIKNTSQLESLDLTQDVKTSLIKKNYSLVDNPDYAQYILQVNVVSCQKNFNGDYVNVDAAGNALTGALVGGGIGAAVGAFNNNIGEGGAIGAGVGLLLGVLDAAIKEQNKDFALFRINVDILVSEKSKTSVIESSSDQKLRRGIGYKQGSQGSIAVSFNEQTNRKKYQTSVISENIVPLKMNEAIPFLRHKIANAISGIF